MSANAGRVTRTPAREGSASRSPRRSVAGRLPPAALPPARSGRSARGAPHPRREGAHICRVSTRRKPSLDDDATSIEDAVEAPAIPGALPFVGNGLTVAQLTGTGFTKDGIVELMGRAVKEFGPVVKCKLGPETCFFINDPDIVTEVAVRRSEKYSQRFVPSGLEMVFTLKEAGYTEEDKAAGGCPFRGLVFVNGEQHKQYRTMALGSLTKKEVKHNIERIVTAKAETCLKRWLAAGGALSEGVRVDQETQRFTVDVIGQAVFSHDFGQLSSSFSVGDPPARFVQEVNGSLVAVSEVIFKDPLGIWRFFDTPAKKKAKQHFSWLKDFEDAIISERRASIDAGNPPGDDFLGTLLTTRDSEGNLLPARDVRWAVHDMFIAGNDTTATSLAAAMALLAVNPDAQEKLRKEVASLEGRAPSGEEAERFPFLDAVCRETLRLYPAGSVFARRLVSKSDDVLGGYRIPSGSVLFASPQVMGRTPGLWTDPERFWPERFLPEGEWCNTTPRNAWIPFGLGSRSCIGGQLALLEMRVVLATLVQHFEFAPAPGNKNGINPDGSLRIAYDITMAYPDGITLSVNPIQRQ